MPTSAQARPAPRGASGCRKVALVLASMGLALLSSCRFSFDKGSQLGGFSPRLHTQVHLVMLASEGEGNRELSRAWASNPTVAHVALLRAEESTSLRDVCKSRACSNRLQPLCDEAIRREADYLIRTMSSLDYSEDFVCDRHEFSLSNPKSDSCAKGHVEGQQTAAYFEFEVIDAQRCQRVQGRQWRDSVSGEETLSYPAAEVLLEKTAGRMGREFAFPEQSRLVASPDGPPMPEAGSLTLEEGQLLAAFRGSKYLGLARAARASGDRFAVEPMTCCYQPRPGDVVQERGIYHLIDAGLGFAVAKKANTGAIAPGLHLHLRRYPVIGGVIMGLSVDMLGDDTYSLAQGSFEVGYQLKPIAGIELLAAATGGLASMQVSAGGSADFGSQLGAVLGINWNPGNWYYVGLELSVAHRFGLEQSSDFLDWRAPIARISGGLEFH